MTPSELAGRQIARLAETAKRNRARFPAAAIVDVLRAGGFEHASVAWACNAAGEELGKQDPGPWVDGAAWVASMDEHNRWFGRGMPLKLNTQVKAGRARSGSYPAMGAARSPTGGSAGGSRGICYLTENQQSCLEGAK